MSNTTTINSDLYSELSKPFKSGDSANETLQEFLNELYLLRQKHCLADVSVIIKATIKGEGVFLYDAHFGSETEVEAMAAWHFGKASAERQSMIRNAISQGSENAIKRSDRKE